MALPRKTTSPASRHVRLIRSVILRAQSVWRTAGTHNAKLRQIRRLVARAWHRPMASLDGPLHAAGRQARMAGAIACKRALWPISRRCAVGPRRANERSVHVAVRRIARTRRDFLMSALDAVLARIDQNLDQSLERLFALLRIPSISTDPAYKVHCREAAAHVAKDLSSIGFEIGMRETAGHPVVIGKGADGAGPRVLFYGHYDVQPVDPLDLWDTPPFEPRISTLPDGRKIIVARGACDDKGQAMTFIEACRAFKQVTGKLPLPITMMIEGEEESGSKHLFGFVRENAAEFRRDLALVCDTGMWGA